MCNGYLELGNPIYSSFFKLDQIHIGVSLFKSYFAKLLTRMVQKLHLPRLIEFKRLICATVGYTWF